MLPKKYRLNKSEEVEKVYKQGKSFFANFLGIKILPNKFEVSRFTFIVGVKIHKKSTKRNRIKRQLREIIRLNMKNLRPGFDVIFIARPGILDAKRGEIKEAVFYLLKKTKLIA